MSKCLNLLVLLIFCLLAQSCGSSQRFMNFGWSSPKQAVLDSIRQWGFSFNSDKQRWEKGMLNGARCSKLRVWFSAQDKLDGAEAKYLGLDTASSAQIRERFLKQLSALHGEPESVKISTGSLEFERIAWRFSPPEESMQDMIVMTCFPDYVIVHAARNMPEPFDLTPLLDAPSSED